MGIGEIGSSYRRGAKHKYQGARKHKPRQAYKSAGLVIQTPESCCWTTSLLLEQTPDPSEPPPRGAPAPGRGGHAGAAPAV